MLPAERVVFRLASGRSAGDHSQAERAWSRLPMRVEFRPEGIERRSQAPAEPGPQTWRGAQPS